MDQHMMKLFDEDICRRGTGCDKWDNCKQEFGRADVLPMWVADMDFKAPQPVIDALVQRAQDGVFGYVKQDDAPHQAVCAWMRRRHALRLRPEWIRISPGVVLSMLYGLKALAGDGGKVAIQTPVYGPFYKMAEIAGLEIVRNPLLNTTSGWRMDLEQLEQAFRQGVQVLMLSSPHNPVGRIWTGDELNALVQLCNRYGVGILSDEIHMDLEMPGYKHTPILNIEGAERAIMLASATKTFNLAGLRHSSIIVKDDALRAKLDRVMIECGVGEPNLFGELAQTVAYEQGEPWLDALLDYLDGNRQTVDEFIRAKLPELVLTRTEGTYLLWLDMRSLALSQDELMNLLVNRAGLGFSNGTGFGPEGEGFVRINVATPRSNVERAMRQLEEAVHAR